MKTTAITLVAALAAVGVGFSGAAHAGNPIVIQASDGPVVLEPSAENEISVTARPLRNFTPVAMTGTVLESHHNSLLLQRADGVVRADLPARTVIDPKGNTMMLSRQFLTGDSVTVFGRLQKNTDIIRVKAEGIYAQTSPTTATLYMLDEPQLQSISKYNYVPNVRATLNRYKARYTPL